jgi:hypothetical protein
MYSNWAQGSMVLGDVDQLIHNGSFLTPKRLILDIVLMGMNIGFPMIWTGMMGWIGINVGRVLSDYVSGNAQPARNTTGLADPVVPAVAKAAAAAEAAVDKAASKAADEAAKAVILTAL